MLLLDLLDGLLLGWDGVGRLGGSRRLARRIQRLRILLVHLVLEGHHLHVLAACRRRRLLDLRLLLGVRVLPVLRVHQSNSLNSRHKFRLVLGLHRSI